MLRRSAGHASAVVVVLVLAGCAAGPRTVDPPDGPAGIVTVLCQARDLADTDPALARDAFERAHLDLHDLADEVSGVDRAAAAELLRAKQRVEAGFSAATPPTDLAARLRTLTDTTAAALAATGIDPPACPPTG